MPQLSVRSGRRIFMSIPLGINARDILRLGTLEAILKLEPPVEVLLLTPARLVEEFHREFASTRVRVSPLSRFRPTEYLGRLVALRRRARSRRLRQLLLRLETHMVRPAPEMVQLFRDAPPALVVTVHPQDWWDWEVVGYARHLGVPTLGIVKSWDNIQRGLRIHPDFLAVWNEVNRQEAIELEGYQAERVRVVGAPPLDPYFDPSVIRPRRDVVRSMGLDPEGKLVVYAPAGQTFDYGEETSTLEELLRIREKVEALRNIQIVCRLHPNSRLEWFWPYRNEPGFAFSFGSYIKTLGWSMTRSEVEDMANLLHHADAVVGGATTVALEAAVFDTPMIVAGYSTVQPEHVERWLKGWTFAKHYRPIVENDWVPIARSSAELEAMLARALSDPGWYAQDRKALVEYYVPFRDGRTAERIAEWIGELTKGSK